jgi:leucyl-tRNA synthetase
MPAHADLSDAQRALRRKTHQTLRGISEGIETMRLNTAVSALMELVNEMVPFAQELGAEDEAGRAVYSEAAESLTLLLAPFAPHVADELWSRLGHEGTTWEQAWPTWEAAVAVEEMMVIAVQVNGKLRDRLEVPAGTDIEEAARLAAELPNVRRHIGGRQVRQVVKVPGRLVNIVVG